MTEELKDCPFCGGKPYFENKGSDYGFYAVSSRRGCWTGTLRTKDETLKRWNARPIENELEAENKMLIGALKAIKKIVDKPPLSIYDAARIYAECCDALGGGKNDA